MSLGRRVSRPAPTSARALLPSMASLGVGYLVEIARASFGGDEDDEDDEGRAEREKYHQLDLACNVGDADRAKELLEGGADPNICDWTGASPLYWACSYGHPECARLLLKHGADVDARDEQLHTPLHKACEQASLECARLLLKHGADVNARDRDGETPLHNACGVGSSAPCARLLLEHGAEPNQGDHFRQTPLHFACVFEHVDCMRLLLEAGADTSAKDGWGQTPEDYVRRTPYGVRVDGRFACTCLVRRANVLRTERGLPADAPLSLDWTVGTHELLADEDRRRLHRALGALLLVDARREGGGTLGREGALAFVAGLARLMGV